MAGRVRDKVRILVFFTPWVTIPLTLLGLVLVAAIPVVLLVPYGWVVYPAAVLAAAGLALWLRPRYRLSILDSSPLGVLTWLQKR